MKSHKNPVKPHKITMNIQSRSRQCQEKKSIFVGEKTPPGLRAMFEQPPVHHRFQGLESTCRSRWQPATV